MTYAWQNWKEAGPGDYSRCAVYRINSTHVVSQQGNDQYRGRCPHFMDELTRLLAGAQHSFLQISECPCTFRSHSSPLAGPQMPFLSQTAHFWVGSFCPKLCFLICPKGSVRNYTTYLGDSGVLGSKQCRSGDTASCVCSRTANRCGFRPFTGLQETQDTALPPGRELTAGYYPMGLAQTLWGAGTSCQPPPPVPTETHVSHSTQGANHGNSSWS